jgi:transcriptional regulator with XRE-family HTH domain
MNLEDFHKRPINGKLRDAIFQAGLTQIRLAEMSNVPRQYISLHINGRFVLTDTQKKRIADALNRPLDELFQ